MIIAFSIKGPHAFCFVMTIKYNCTSTMILGFIYCLRTIKQGLTNIRSIFLVKWVSIRSVFSVEGVIIWVIIITRLRSLFIVLGCGYTGYIKRIFKLICSQAQVSCGGYHRTHRFSQSKTCVAAVIVLVKVQQHDAVSFE